MNIINWDNLKKVNWDKMKKGDCLIDDKGKIFEYTGLNQHHRSFNSFDFVFRRVNPADGEPKNQAIILPGNTKVLDEELRLLFESLD